MPRAGTAVKRRKIKKRKIGMHNDLVLCGERPGGGTQPTVRDGERQGRQGPRGAFDTEGLVHPVGLAGRI